MAYVIKISKAAQEQLTKRVCTTPPPHDHYAIDVLANAIRGALSTLVTYEWTTNVNARTHAVAFELRTVRLITSTPYCGNHAGPCIVRFAGVRARRTGRWLEGEDWIKVHALVNGVLDAYGVACDVYTNGADVFTVPGIPKKRMVVRSATLGARRRFDYTDGAKPGDTFPHYRWNPGTDDQFESGTGYESDET